MTFQRFANSLATRIIVFGLGLLVMGNVLRYFVLTEFMREDVTKVMAAQQLTLANYVAREVDLKMLERQDMLRQMAGALPQALLQQPPALQSWLALRHQHQPLFSLGLLVVDAAGQTLAGFTPREGQALPQYGGTELIRAALSSGMVTGRPLLDTANSQAVLPLAVPVKDRAGTVRAILIGVTDLATPGFLSFTEQDRIGKLGGFLLISPRDHVFVASTKPEMVLKPTPPTGVNALHDRAMAGYRGSGVTVNAQGMEEISAIASVPSTGWFVVARLPTAEALSVVARTQRFVTVNSILVVIGFLFITTTGLYYVFRPLLQAARQADRMTLGEIPLEPLTVVRPDEVGHLTEAFNRLLAKLQDSQAEMAHMAHHDVLTGLPNRALLADRMAQALSRANRNRRHVALLCIDLDRFKPINDELGHEAGDQTLVEIARRLTAAMRESDTLARFGGDEFVVLLADLDPDLEVAQAAAAAVASKCLDAVAPPLRLQSKNYCMGASIGIAMGDGATLPQTLLHAADAAMYQAKQAGGQRFAVSCAPYAMAASPAMAKA